MDLYSVHHDDKQKFFGHNYILKKANWQATFQHFKKKKKQICEVFVVSIYGVYGIAG